MEFIFTKLGKKSCLKLIFYSNAYSFIFESALSYLRKFNSIGSKGYFTLCVFWKKFVSWLSFGFGSWRSSDCPMTTSLPCLQKFVLPERYLWHEICISSQRKVVKIIVLFLYSWKVKNIHVNLISKIPQYTSVFSAVGRWRNSR